MRGSPRSAETRERSRRLRRDGSDAEALLWRRLRARQLAGAKLRRQHPIGAYFADFCCVEAPLVIELDGGQHAEQAGHDERRSADLAAQGFRVLRFWNHDVLARTEAVLEAIAAELARASKID